MSCTTTRWEFYPGEKKTLEINLVAYNKAIDCKQPFTIPTNPGRKIQVEIPALPTNLVFDLTTTPVVQVVSEILGKLKVDLRPADTNVMQTGSVIVTIDEDGTGANVRKAVAAAVIQKRTASTCSG